MTLTKNQQIGLYIAVAFIFSLAIRLIWVYQFNGYENFMWNNQFMINTNDGYFWAEGARDLLSGITQPNDLSPMHRAGSQLTAFFAYILPFSFESVIFYLPAFLSSLVVIPIILIANELKELKTGFISALVASIAWSYYNRTMVGYFDTDMLNILFPMLLLWSLILALHSREEKYLIISALLIIAYTWWYPKSFSLEFAFLGLITLYTLVFERKEAYMYKLLSIMLIAMMGLPLLAKTLAVIAVFIVYKVTDSKKYIFYILGIAVGLFFITGGLSPIVSKLKDYIFTDSVTDTKEGLQVHFFSVMQTIREAGKIPFETFANRISGHTITFILSIIGYGLLAFRHRVMLLGLPLIGLGFLAYVGGLRFTIYAVPIMAFGIGFLIITCSQYIKNNIAKYAFITLATLAILYPNVLHVISYKVPTVMNKQEVTVLDKLQKIADREDYVVSWWDYGYPIRYYSDVKTLIDGGKHSGSVNFPVSYMLTNPQNVSAKLARFDVEYTEKMFKVRDENLLKSEENRTLIQSNIAQMTLDSGFKDTNDFLTSLHVKENLPKKTRDIYFYLPYRMMGILPTVAKFSDIDLMTGKTNRRPFFYKTTRYRDAKGMLNLGNGIIFDKKRGTLIISNQEVAVKDFFVTSYDKNGKLLRQKQSIKQNGRFSLVYMKAYNTILVLDQNMLNSTYIQLFVFDNYDKNLFEPVILTGSSKVYKLII